MKKEKFYVTTPIYYANDVPHIGHAYTTIIADILARWNRLHGKEVFFLTGTDEHGKKIQKIAEEKGVKPKEFVDNISKGFKKAWKSLNINYDNFIRTTDEKHIRFVQNVLRKLYKRKFIYKGNYESFYCVGCEQYKTRNELDEGKCPVHKKEAEKRKEEAYLFKLGAFQKQLTDLIKKDKYKIRPIERKNEILGFLDNKLQDICISRRKEEVYWGIELPFDKNYTCYVWIDAFLNYLTGLKEKKFWPADIQFMSKDIFRVHVTIWPALLLALNEKLPKELFIHGYFTVNGEKMSKSLGNVISPVAISEKYSSDVLRYFIIRHIPSGQDGDFSEEALIERNNNELANKLGNLVSRVSGLIEKNGFDPGNSELLGKLDEKKIINFIENYELDKALSEIFFFIDLCNEYVQEKKPWETKDRKVLGNLKEAILKISGLLLPFIPESAEKIKKVFISKKIKKSDVLFKKI